MNNYKNNLITVLGHTAAGKTGFGVRLACELDTEIISADSRQVYRGMDIGTGKDLDEYNIEGKQVPYHLIDILPAGAKYNVFEFQKDFFLAFDEISNKNKIPIMCGGTGMYIESVLNAYKLIHVPVNESLREELQLLDIEKLEKILKSYKRPHNRSDLDTKKRAIRAIEIAEFYKDSEAKMLDYPRINSLLIGVKYDRDIRRQRITQRLKQRLDNGMIEEAKSLYNSGVSFEDMEYYGLEYRFLAWYLSGKVDYNTMFEKLNTAIHQFAKRQMTWFRKMEKDGHCILWINTEKTVEENIENVLMLLKEAK
jgi:tRNA dimethylallyltransferase